MAIKFPAHSRNYATGRCGSGAIKGIVVIEVNQDAQSLLQQAKVCATWNKNGGTPPCQTSFNYVYDPLKDKLYETVAVANTPYTFDQQNSTCQVPAASPLLAGEAVGTSPNCTAVTVAIAQPQQEAFGHECDFATSLSKFHVMLAEVLAAAQAITPALTDASIAVFASDFVKGLGVDQGALTQFCGCEDDVTIADILATPIIVPTIFSALCLQIGLLPAGVPVTVVGRDATGACVLGPAAVDPCDAMKAFPDGVAVKGIGIDAADNCVKFVPLQKYSADHNFAALVPLVITHNLNLADPLAYVLELRESFANGGDDFAVQVTAATANSLTLLSNTTQAGVRVTVIG